MIKQEILKRSGLNEASQEDMSYIERILYIMMEERVVPGIYKATFQNMKENLESAKMSESELRRYLQLAIDLGYVERIDDKYFQMTQKAKKYISFRES